MSKGEKQFWNKITKINFILSILIVCLHSSNIYLLNSTEELYYLAANIQNTVKIIADSAVPTFFLISSFLFYRNFNINTFKSKLKSRIFTLVIPYFFWSTIYLIYYAILSRIDLFSLSLDNPVSLDILSIIKNIFMATYDSPIWFIRVLFIYILMSPVIYIALKTLKKYGIILVFILFGINIIFSFKYSNPMFWSPVYLLGAWLGMYYKNYIITYLKKDGEYKKSFFIALIYYIVMIIINLSLDDKNLIYYTYRMTSPLFICQLCKIIDCNTSPKKWQKISFFIFCAHIGVVQLVRIIFSIIMPRNFITITISYFGIAIVTVIILIVLSQVIKNNFKSLWRIMTGGR